MRNQIDTALPHRPVSWELLALLRAVLAWIVLCVHLSLFAPQPGWQHAINEFGGKAAVVGFLLVSGFSIAASLERDADGFYMRRFMRVYPLYLVAIVFAMAVQIASGGHVVTPAISVDGLGWKTNLANLFFLQTFVVRPIQFDWPVWSLALEVFYYALAPLFGRLDRRILIVIILISFTCYLLPTHTDWGIVYFVLTKFNALEYIWCWLLGFLLWRDSGRVALYLSLIGIPAMLWGHYTPEPLSVVTYAVALAMIALSDRVVMTGRLRAFADYLGDLSYPLYVFHVPALLLGYSILKLRAGNALVIPALLVTIAAYHGVDRYLKRRFLLPLVRRKKSLPATPAAAVAPPLEST
jgi:peptidoglycan/LPS O-acetylase OafA/YrhL